MARITVEDCVEKIPNKFQLVLLAARRAYEISSGSPVLIDRDNDKDPVVALREIAMGKLSISDLEDALIRSMKKNIDKDKLDDESFMDFIRQEQKDTSTNSASNKRADPSEMIFEDIDFNSLSD